MKEEEGKEVKWEELLRKKYFNLKLAIDKGREQKPDTIRKLKKEKEEMPSSQIQKNEIRSTKNNMESLIKIPMFGRDTTKAT